jgi:hypothetical protein
MELDNHPYEILNSFVNSSDIFHSPFLFVLKLPQGNATTAFEDRLTQKTNHSIYSGIN